MADNLQSYLASKYMSGPKAEAILLSMGDPNSSRKKRKKKAREEAVIEQGSSSGLILKDADDELWRLDVEEEDNVPRKI